MKNQIVRLHSHVVHQFTKLQEKLVPTFYDEDLKMSLPKIEAKKIHEILNQHDEEPTLSAEELETLTDEDMMCSRPVLTMRRTMLFGGQNTSMKCNFLSAHFFRSNIRQAFAWAVDHGIDVFIVDYTNPIGLLAMETLIGLRNAGEFYLYAVQGRTISKRKSYRLIWETNLELIFLVQKCDYNYGRLFVREMDEEIFSKSGVIYTEKEMYVRKEILKEINK